MLYHMTEKIIKQGIVERNYIYIACPGLELHNRDNILFHIT